MPRVLTDHTGRTFGRLTVTGPSDRPAGKGGRYWECRCDCGATRVVGYSSLRRGTTTSCGCYMRERVSQTSRRHGHATRECGLSPEYGAWRAMVRRCHNPNQSNYPYYGGRGIVVCDGWRKDFAAFLAHIGPMPADGKRYSVDRIDNARGYEPGNVRWADRLAQANNKRNSRTITHAGRTLTIAQWARETGLTVGTITRRVRLGWTAERTLTVQPIPGGHYSATESPAPPR